MSEVHAGANRQPFSSGGKWGRQVLFSATANNNVEASQPLTGGLADKKTTSSAGAKGAHSWWDRFLLVAPLSNFVGGVSLLLGALLPSNAPTNPSKPMSLPTTPQTVQASETRSEQTHWGVSPEVKAFFTSAGWTLSTLGLFTGCVNGLTLGFVSKQPSMVVSSLCNLITTPLIMVDPTLCARTAMWFFTGPWLAGFANRVRNENYLAPGEAPRELDMTSLVNLSSLRKQISVGEKPANGTKMAATWMRQAGGTLKFVAQDQWLLLSDSAHNIKHILTHPKESASAVAQGFGEIIQRVRGQRKGPLSFVKPSIAQNQVGAMLMYVGATPVLLMGGQPSQVSEVCTKLLALGLLSANTSLFASALQQKDKTLMVGIPLGIVGNAMMQTNVGMGMAQISTGMVQNYFRNEIYKQQAPQQPASQGAASAPDDKMTPTPTASISSPET